MAPDHRFMPVLATVAGIAAFSAMDAAMKGASLAVGVYTALLLRNAFGTLWSLPLWFKAGRPLPGRRGAIVHSQRALITAFMAWLFFQGLVRLPLAEGMALSFIAPLIALYFAAVLLGERIRPQAVQSSLLGLVGVAAITAGRIGQGEWTDDAAMGTGAILLSALLYAVNLALQRRQALLAGPAEIALFQNLLIMLVLLPAAPWLLVRCDLDTLLTIIAAGALATVALLALAWGYARAEAQVLVPIEYTAFLWAALLGWLFFAEAPRLATLGGAALIVTGCLLAARKAAPREAGARSGP